MTAYSRYFRLKTFQVLPPAWRLFQSNVVSSGKFLKVYIFVV